MLILNTTKPFYVDKINKVVRMGNFKETGKEIEYQSDVFLLLIENLKESINEEKLIEKVSKETNVSKSELKDVISYLFEEKLIIENEKYEALCDNKYSRQDLFFHYLQMILNKIKNYLLIKNINFRIRWSRR